MVASAQGISEIIPGKLYLGSEKDAQDLEELSRLGITHILNVTPQKNRHEKSFTYMRIAIEDGGDQIGRYFEQAISFIEQASVVFVHCRHGISRSATIVTSYLMKKNSWDYKKALSSLKEKRPKVALHILFITELSLYQQQLHIGKSCSRLR